MILRRVSNSSQCHSMHFTAYTSHGIERNAYLCTYTRYNRIFARTSRALDSPDSRQRLLSGPDIQPRLPSRRKQPRELTRVDPRIAEAKSARALKHIEKNSRIQPITQRITEEADILMKRQKLICANTQTNKLTERLKDRKAS